MIDRAGTVRAGDDVLVDPELVAGLKNPYAPLEARLASIAAAMQHGELGRFTVADDPLVVRADEHTPFVHVQRVMEACGRSDVLIWRLYLASGDAAPVAAHLPTDDQVGAPPEELEEGAEVVSVEPVERVEVLLRVREAGTKVDPRTGQAWSGEGPYVLEGREIQYSIGPFKTVDVAAFHARLRQVRKLVDRQVVIDPRRGVTMGEVMQVLTFVQDLKFPGVNFVGAYGVPADDFVMEDR